MRAAAFLRAAGPVHAVRGTPRQESLGTRPGVVDRAKGRQGAGRRHHLSEPAGYGLHVRHRGASGGRRGAAAGQRRSALDRVSIVVAQPFQDCVQESPTSAVDEQQDDVWKRKPQPHRVKPPKTMKDGRRVTPGRRSSTRPTRPSPRKTRVSAKRRPIVRSTIPGCTQREAKQLLAQTQINERETHNERQEALQLLAKTRAHEQTARRIVGHTEPPESK